MIWKENLFTYILQSTSLDEAQTKMSKDGGYILTTVLCPFPPASPVDEQVGRESSPSEWASTNLSSAVFAALTGFEPLIKGCLVRIQYLFGHRAVRAQSRNRIVLKLSI